jgi:hypothetical protein
MTFSSANFSGFRQVIGAILGEPGLRAEIVFVSMALTINPGLAVVVAEGNSVEIHLDRFKDVEVQSHQFIERVKVRHSPTWNFAAGRCLPYFLGAIRAKIILRALILRRWRAKFSLSKTQVTGPWHTDM